MTFNVCSCTFCSETTEHRWSSQKRNWKMSTRNWGFWPARKVVCDIPCLGLEYEMSMVVTAPIHGFRIFNPLIFLKRPTHISPVIFSSVQTDRPTLLYLLSVINHKLSWTWKWTWTRWWATCQYWNVFHRLHRHLVKENDLMKFAVRTNMRIRFTSRRF